MAAEKKKTSSLSGGRQPPELASPVALAPGALGALTQPRSPMRESQELETALLIPNAAAERSRPRPGAFDISFTLAFGLLSRRIILGLLREGRLER